jgi:NADH-quinone oxidoreductase subunit M
MQIICHGISTGTLFFLVGALQERIRTRDMNRMGGFWSTMPRMGGVMLFFALASLGLPGLGNFVGEFLVLNGAYQAHAGLTALAAIGFVFATIYSLWIIHRVFHGSKAEYPPLPDLLVRELAVTGVMIAALVWLGLNPQPIFKISQPALHNLQQSAILTQRGTMSSPGVDFGRARATPAQAKVARSPERPFGHGGMP